MSRAFRHRSFMLYAITHWISALGFWSYRIGVGWLTWKLTHSGLWLGIISATEAFPMFLLLPIGGAIADRVDRLVMYRHTQSILTVLSVILATLIYLDMINIYLLLVIMALAGTANALSMPGRMTIVPGVVPRPDVPAAIAFDSILFQISVFIGPAIAGVIIARLGIAWAFYFNALTYIAFIFALYSIRMLHHEHVATKATGVVADMWEGILYVARHPSIGPMIAVMVASTVLVKPFMDLLPGFADGVFGRGAPGLATLASAAGIGGLIGGFYMAHIGRAQGMTAIVLAAICFNALFIIGFSFIPWFWFAVVLSALISAMSVATGTGSQILVQNAVDGAMRARVMSLYALTWRGVPSLGALAMGGVSTFVGLQWALGGGAALCLAAWYLAHRRRDSLAEGLEVAQAPAE